MLIHRTFCRSCQGKECSILQPVDTCLLALFGGHLLGFPRGVAALVARDAESVRFVLVEQAVPAVYADRDDGLVRGTAALYGGELGIVYLVDVLVELQELRHAELAVGAVAQELVAGVLDTLPAPAELHQLLAEDSPETDTLAADLDGVAHSGEIDRKAINEGHHLGGGGGRLVAEDREGVTARACRCSSRERNFLRNPRARRYRRFSGWATLEGLGDCLHCSVRF